MNVSVIGNGRWGSFLAWYLDRAGHNVTLCGRKGSAKTQQLIETRTNGYVTLPESIKLADGVENALENGVVVVSVPSQSLRGLMKDLVRAGAEGKLFVLCMKGIEISTGKRLSEVVEETAGGQNRVAVWLGPGHVQEFVREVPNCMVIDAPQQADKELLVDAFGSELIRFYYGEDMIGNEVGAAAKNVVGIAAGMLDGYGLSSLKGALMSRGTREFARLIKAMGGKEHSAYGLCHLGDYEATVFSPHSHNRRFGEMFVKGEKFESLAEGYYTVQALVNLAKQYDVELPISNAVYNILYKGEDAQEALGGLFARSIKREFM